MTERFTFVINLATVSTLEETFQSLRVLDVVGVES